VSNYQFYSFQAIPQPNFDAAMQELAAMFQKSLKDNLAKPYPYAPGYFGQKPSTGLRDMKKKTGNLYNSINVSFDPQTNRMRVSMLEYWKNVNDGRQPGKVKHVARGSWFARGSWQVSLDRHSGN
jgi:hypothetical protein